MPDPARRPPRRITERTTAWPVAGVWREMPQGIWLALLLALAVLIGMPGRAGSPPEEAPGDPAVLQLGRHTPAVPAWPAVRMLEDTEHQLDAPGAHRALGRFQPPNSPYQNLGQRRATIWLHSAIALDEQAPERWVAQIDYPLLHDIEFHVFDRQGRLLQSQRTGAVIPFSQRPLGTRAVAVELQLQPGERYDVLLRVRSSTALILPLQFMQWSALTAHESREQILQGIMIGLTLFMLAYSLTRWVSLRQPMFLAYALMIVSALAFWMAFFGTGSQYLWGDTPWLAMNMSAGASLPVVAANIYFSLYALDVARTWPRVALLLQALAVFMLAALLLFATGTISYRSCAVLGSVTAVGHILLLLPFAAMRWRDGDRAALFLALGWLSYLGGLVLITTLLRGAWPANTWTLHGGQLGAAGEMLCWLMVLGLRVEHLREAAERTRREHDLLHALAHTDPLTGLANRRGLELALQSGLGDNGPQSLKALFVLDLDGFKQINDELGHEAGDAVLTTVARRLKDGTRPGDVVARLGGDEFVVVATGLKSPGDAAAVGQKLLAQFAQPHLLAGGELRRVGVTIGYSLASGPVRDAAAWTREADAAMYVGKQSGKHCVTAYAELTAAGAEAAGTQWQST